MTRNIFNESATRGTKVVYHMYIMASESGVLYTGVTNFLERRVAEHKIGQVSGFSQKYKTSKLVYFEPFGDIRNAIAREKQLKRWRRGKKVSLIEKINPTWRDLSEDFNR
jgi:putative endonuclease